MPATAEAARQFARKALRDAEAIRHELDLRFDAERERRAEELAEEETRRFYEEHEA